ncbi:unnamed protein product [Timema podura]|uniref:Dynein regulatory complex protein 1/2 N-terminal domain-containing protein n=1 Tax=Timema podura TaxID=61482 RepID=A0ABN7NN58_TIMPD|nr:unnamed protein product [Timema podura]
MEENSQNHDINEETEPQATSFDPNERKLARRLRIQRRAEALRRQQMQVGQETVEEVEKTQVEQQVETSNKDLQTLVSEGLELIQLMSLGLGVDTVDVCWLVVDEADVFGLGLDTADVFRVGLDTADVFRVGVDTADVFRLRVHSCSRVTTLTRDKLTCPNVSSNQSVSARSKPEPLSSSRPYAANRAGGIKEQRCARTQKEKSQVTNVRIANDAREVKRREENVAAHKERMAKLDQELVAGAQKLEEINARWEGILETNDPLDLYHDIHHQRVKCSELMSQKDQLIQELRKELHLADDRFMRDQRRQKQDLGLLCERIDQQVVVMSRAYKQELLLVEVGNGTGATAGRGTLLEERQTKENGRWVRHKEIPLVFKAPVDARTDLLDDAISRERHQLIEAGKRKWEGLYKARDKLELSHMDKKMHTAQQFEQEMYKIHKENEEHYRAKKVQLETDLQVLQQELEQVKALCLLNMEKLDYNYQVLKKRDEENIIMKSQQKRRINK